MSMADGAATAGVGEDLYDDEGSGEENEEEETRYTIEPDMERIQACYSDVRVAVSMARTKVQGQGQTGSQAAYMARVRDIFTTLTDHVETTVSEFSTDETANANRQLEASLRAHAERYEAEISSLRKESLEQLERQKTELREEQSRELGDMVGRLTQERDQLIKQQKSREAELEIRFGLNTGSSGEQLDKSEAALARQEAASAKAQAKQLQEKVNKLQDGARKAKDEWAAAVTEITATVKNGKSALNAAFEVRATEPEDASRPWRAKRATPVEQLNKLLEKHELPGEQLKALVGAYEEAMRQAQKNASDATALAEKSTAHAKAAATEMNERLRAERLELRLYENVLKLELRDSETSMTGMNEMITKLQKELKEVEAVAREKARVESRRLEGELEAKQGEIESLRREIASLKESREAADEKHKTEVHLLRSSLERMQSKLNACSKALSMTQAAGSHGGYYCSGAPSLQSGQKSPPPGATPQSLSPQRLSPYGTASSTSFYGGSGRMSPSSSSIQDVVELNDGSSSSAALRSAALRYRPRSGSPPLFRGGANWHGASPPWSPASLCSPQAVRLSSSPGHSPVVSPAGQVVGSRIQVSATLQASPGADEASTLRPAATSTSSQKLERRWNPAIEAAGGTTPPSQASIRRVVQRKLVLRAENVRSQESRALDTTEQPQQSHRRRRRVKGDTSHRGKGDTSHRGSDTSQSIRSGLSQTL